MTKTTKQAQGFSDEERSAMQERAKELLLSRDEGETALLSKIAQMPEPDRSMAQRLHEIIMTSAPTLAPKTWYGMPAYANKEGKVVCFFQGAHKFKYRYSTLGFNDPAHLDDGSMWPTTFALMKLTPEVEMRIASLVKQAVYKR